MAILQLQNHQLPIDGATDQFFYKIDGRRRRALDVVVVIDVDVVLVINVVDPPY